MIETERLIIRCFMQKDKFDYYKNIASDKDVTDAFMTKYVDSISDCNIDSLINRVDPYILAIELKSSKEVIGIIDNFDSGEKTEIGYAIGKSFWNRGYATEALNAFIDFLVKKGIKTFLAGFFKGNEYSKKVLEHVGMKYYKTIPNEIYWNGKYHDCIYYILNK